MQKVLNGDDAISEVFFFRSLRSFPSNFPLARFVTLRGDIYGILIELLISPCWWWCCC